MELHIKSWHRYVLVYHDVYHCEYPQYFYADSTQYPSSFFTSKWKNEVSFIVEVTSPRTSYCQHGGSDRECRLQSGDPPCDHRRWLHPGSSQVSAVLTAETNLGKIKHFRIPNPSKKIVLYLHGYESSSADIVMKGKDQSLGFLLSDRDYDVWMINFRKDFKQNNRISQRIMIFDFLYSLDRKLKPLLSEETDIHVITLWVKRNTYWVSQKRIK